MTVVNKSRKLVSNTLPVDCWGVVSSFVEKGADYVSLMSINKTLVSYAYFERAGTLFRASERVRFFFQAFDIRREWGSHKQDDELGRRFDSKRYDDMDGSLFKTVPFVTHIVVVLPYDISDADINTTISMISGGKFPNLTILSIGARVMIERPHPVMFPVLKGSSALPCRLQGLNIEYVDLRLHMNDIRRFPYHAVLKSLHLRALSDQTLLSWDGFSVFTNLEKLLLEFCPIANGSEFGNVLIKMKKLKSLIISYCTTELDFYPDLEQEGASELVEFQYQTFVPGWQDQHNIEEDSNEIIFRRMKKLNHLELIIESYFDCTCFSSQVRTFKGRFKDGNQIDVGSFLSPERQLETLRLIQFERSQREIKERVPLQVITALTELEISQNVHLCNSQLLLCVNLKRLTFYDGINEKLSDDSFKNLKKLESLTFSEDFLLVPDVVGNRTGQLTPKCLIQCPDNLKIVYLYKELPCSPFFHRSLFFKETRVKLVKTPLVGSNRESVDVTVPLCEVIDCEECKKTIEYFTTPGYPQDVTKIILIHTQFFCEK